MELFGSSEAEESSESNSSSRIHVLLAFDGVQGVTMTEGR